MKEGITMDEDRMTIIPEMIKEGSSFKVVTKEDSYKIVLRPSVISHSLEEKLSPEDISKGMAIVNRQIGLSNLNVRLQNRCCNINCTAKNNCMFRALPNGNTNANVMFINKMPTDYEIATMTSHSDKIGVFLSLILSKMNVPRDSVYCTDMIKCNTQLDEQSYNECINAYIAKEIEYVQPKVIICNGLSLLKACIKSGLLIDLPLEVTYGKIYDAKTKSDIPIKVIAIYDLNTVLQKTGTDYEKCKTDLWTQILSAFKASV
jgi:uracil-DNA glycosylase family 4